MIVTRGIGISYGTLVAGGLALTGGILPVPSIPGIVCLALGGCVVVLTLEAC